MRKPPFQFAMSTLILVTGLLLSVPFSSAKPDYMKRENKGCVYCHNAPNKNGLNEMGKCYAEHGHSLDACDPGKKASAR